MLRGLWIISISFSQFRDFSNISSFWGTVIYYSRSFGGASEHGKGSHGDNYLIPVEPLVPCGASFCCLSHWDDWEGSALFLTSWAFYLILVMFCVRRLFKVILNKIVVKLLKNIFIFVRLLAMMIIILFLHCFPQRICTKVNNKYDPRRVCTKQIYMYIYMVPGEFVLK